MPIRNRHWYDVNESVSYPVDETATATSDGGVRLPSSVLVDCKLFYPRGLGAYPFLAGVTVTDRLVSLTFEAADEPDGPTAFSPLAVVSVPQPAPEGRQIPVEPQAAGVGGWVVLGSGVRDLARGAAASPRRAFPPLFARFSSPRQSLLTARAFRAYRPLPVAGLGVLAADAPLAGLVRLAAEPPFQIVREDRVLDGRLQEVVVVRLAAAAAAGGFEASAAQQALLGGGAVENVFRDLAGPCAGRPESRSCGDPEPIELLGAVAPDCDGRITIVLRGCATAAQVEGECGVVLDCDLGLARACPPPEIPDDEGRLPSEYDPVEIPPYVPVDPPVDPPESESVVEVGALPYTDCFPDGTALDFVVKDGSWGEARDDDPGKHDYCGGESFSDSESIPDEHAGYAPLGAGGRSVSVWDGFDVSTLGRRVVVDLKLRGGPPGARHNGGVVLNYRPHTSQAGRFVYYLADVDYDSQELRIRRFTGVSLVTAAAAVVPGITLDHWYRLTATVRPGPTAGSTALTVRLDGLTNPLLAATLGPLNVSNYQPSAPGLFGLGTDRAVTTFGLFRVEMAP